LEQPLHSNYEPIEIDLVRGRRLLRRKSEELGREPRPAFSRLQGCREQPSRGRIAAPEPGAEQLEIAEERGQQIVEVVRDPADELADRLQPLNPLEPILDPIGGVTSGHNNATLAEINQDDQRITLETRRTILLLFPGLRYTSVLAPMRSVISR
jgi:hypothetical protein